jgi:hypothetical protein
MLAFLSSGRMQILTQYGEGAIVRDAAITRPGAVTAIETGGNEDKKLFLRSTTQPPQNPRSI